MQPFGEHHTMALLGSSAILRTTKKKRKEKDKKDENGVEKISYNLSMQINKTSL